MQLNDLIQKCRHELKELIQLLAHQYINNKTLFGAKTDARIFLRGFHLSREAKSFLRARFEENYEFRAKV